MEPISFATTTAENIYNATLKRTATTDGQEKVDIMFHGAALLDFDPELPPEVASELTEEEAQKVVDALNKYDQGRLRSLGYIKYDDQEVDSTWEDADGLGFPLDSKTWEYLQSIENNFARALATHLLHLAYFFPQSEDLWEILSYYQQMANHPDVEIDHLISLIVSVMDMYTEQGPYDPESGEIRANLDIPSFNLEEYLKAVLGQARKAAKIHYDAFVFAKDLETELEANSENYTYLEQAAKSENVFLQAEALLKLGEIQRGRALIINVLESREEHFIVTAAAFEALSYFTDEQTVNGLVNLLINSPFENANLARSSLANYRAPAIVLQKLEEMLDSEDAFVRGEAASLVKYFIGKPSFESFRSSIEPKIARLSQNKNEEPLVRATAKATLESIRTNTPETLSDDPLDQIVQTLFFRHPKQLEWAVKKIRERAGTPELQGSSEIIQILSVGSSIGAEPLSIIMAVLEDYDSNASAWGNFNPRERLTIIASDIDLSVLRYMQRGIYHRHGSPERDEFFALELHSQCHGKDSDYHLDKYFDCIPNLNICPIKDEYYDMLEIRQLDIVEGAPELAGQSLIVFYNNVARYVGGAEATTLAAENVCELSGKYIAPYIDPEDIISGHVFHRRATKVDPEYSHFMEKK
ncbi:MAG: hypothetical protein HQ596_07260 [Candidatus Saganbacteria bacterium]|nr:hypothetical protein [Candidatus Saganbacteria bacterium]